MFQVIVKSHKKYNVVYGTYPTQAEAEQVAKTLKLKRWQEAYVEKAQTHLFYDETAYVPAEAWGTREFV